MALLPGREVRLPVQLLELGQTDRQKRLHWHELSGCGGSWWRNRDGRNLKVGSEAAEQGRKGWD